MNRIRVWSLALIALAVLIAALSPWAGRLRRLAPVSPLAHSQADAAPVTVAATTAPTVAAETAEPTGEATIDPYVLTLTAYPTFPDTPTPWPEGFQPKEGPTATITPTPAKVINWAEGAPITQTMVYIVQRVDGHHEKYLVANTLLPTDETYRQVRDQLLNLGPQDILIDARPLDSRPKERPPVEVLLPEEIATSSPK